MRKPVHQLMLSADGQGGSVAVADFEAWCAAHAASACTVWLAAELTLPLRAEPGSHFADETSLAAWARRVHAHYGHETQGAVAGWRSGGVAGACLLQGTALEDLQASAARHGVTLVALRPYWAGAMALAFSEQHALRRGPGLLLVAQGRVVTALSLAGGVIASVTQHWLAKADAAELAGLLQADHTTVVVGHGLAGTAPAGALVLGSVQQDAADAAAALRNHSPAAPDFIVHSPQALRRLGWALGATGLCVLALAGQDALQAHAELQALQQGAAGRPSQALQPAAGAPASDAAARARLAHPWPAVVAAAEATVPRGGHWLGLEHRAGQRELRLQGVAASLHDAMAAADQVRRTTGVDDAFVARSAALAERGVEFEIQARLAP